MTFETQQAILEVLEKYNSPIPRFVICEELGLPMTTAFDNLKTLFRKKLVQKEKEERHSRGRPIILWRIGRNA